MLGSWIWTNRSSTVAPNANDGHCETSKANSSSCLLKGLRRFDSLLDCFAIDVVLILSGNRLARDKIGGGSKTSDQRSPEQIGMSAASWRESVGKIEGE